MTLSIGGLLLRRFICTEYTLETACDNVCSVSAYSPSAIVVARMCFCAATIMRQIAIVLRKSSVDI